MRIEFRPGVKNGSCRVHNLSLTIQATINDLGCPVCQVSAVSQNVGAEIRKKRVLTRTTGETISPSGNNCRPLFKLASEWPEGVLMLRWGVAPCAALLALSLVGPARAQMPSPGSSGLKYVAIDTTKNLAAPIPVVPVQPKKSLLSRTVNSFKSLNPLAKTPTPPVGQAAQSLQQGSLLKSLSNNVKLPSIPPKVSDVVTGTIK